MKKVLLILFCLSIGLSLSAQSNGDTSRQLEFIQKNKGDDPLLTEVYQYLLKNQGNWSKAKVQSSNVWIVVEASWVLFSSQSSASLKLNVPEKMIRVLQGDKLLTGVCLDFGKGKNWFTYHRKKKKLKSF